MTAVILGMPLDVAEGDPVNTITPLCGFVVVKGMDAAGQIGYYTAATEGLTTVECLGMADYAELKLRRKLQRQMDGE